jgi:hypothetical protein
MMLVLINPSGLKGLITIGNYLISIFFGWGLSRYLYVNERRAEAIIELYIKLFFFIPICAILSILFFIIMGDVESLNIYNKAYDYLVTPFGILIPKDFVLIKVYRSFFYFIEPVFLAPFYVANIFVIAPYLNRKSRIFIVLNLIGGILTYSYLFAVMMVTVYLVRQVKFSIKAILLIFAGAILIQLLMLIDFFKHSSLNDRLSQIDLYYDILYNSDVLQLLFGHGFVVDSTALQFSAGAVSSIYEIGFLNMIFSTLIVIVLTKKTFPVFVIFLISMLAFEPIKQPMFWFLMVAMSYALKDREISTRFRFN